MGFQSAVSKLECGERRQLDALSSIGNFWKQVNRVGRH
jgi:hypothetical protein